MTDTSRLIEKLETLLGEGMPVKGDTLEEKLNFLGNGDLPDDLKDMLQKLVKEPARIHTDIQEQMEYAFQCGQAHERLENFIHGRLASNIAFHAPDGTPPLIELESKDFDTLARFVALRDNLLKTIADYTLKFLLVSVILLVIGLTLGLI